MSFSTTTRLSQPLRSHVETELRPGERITWVDQPIPSLMARKAWPVVILGVCFSIPGFLQMVDYAKAVLRGDLMPSSELFFASPFLLIGIYMLASPYAASRHSKQCAYVLTDRRAIVLWVGWRGGITVRSFEPQSLTDLKRKQNADGSGDLVFIRGEISTGEGGRFATNAGFLAVPDVKNVEERVKVLAQTVSRDSA